MKPLEIALLGAGRIGRVHATSVSRDPGSRLALIADAHAGAAASLAAEHGARVASVAEALADPSIDAVLIATSTDTHADLIEAASAAGKAVLCEKPVDLALARALACRDAIAGREAPVMIGLNRRFDPSFAALASAFAAGEIGRGELLTITSFDPAPPPLSYIEVSGGLFRDMAIHDFDIVNWLFGSTPTRVGAVASALVDPAIGAAGDVDTAVTTLAWDDGRIAVVRNSRRAAYGYDQRIELLGSEGLLGVRNVLENALEKITATGNLSAKPEHFFLERYARAYAIEWAAFVRAVRTGVAPPVTLDDGINALAVAEAATLAASSGRTVEMHGTTFGIAS